VIQGWTDEHVKGDFMAKLSRVDVGKFDPQRFGGVLTPERYQEFMTIVDAAAPFFEGRVVWNVNSTDKGGGVAEMLRSLLAYAQGAGVDARWIVIEGNPEFFHITKRIHNHLHGSPGDGGKLGDEEQSAYCSTLAPNAEELARLVSPGDIVILHDPQTAGMAKALKDAASLVIWRCHVGLDVPNDLARNAWRFLVPHVAQADAHVFSRQVFVWEGLQSEKTTIIPPSIDAFSPKNQDLKDETVTAILRAAGLSDEETDAPAEFTREDGSSGVVKSKTVFADGGPPPPFDCPVVTQVSRWDRLKDPLGVIEGFARYVAPRTNAHLVVAGPSVEAVADDPEGADVLREATRAWESLDESVKQRVHLACLPMKEGEENAAIVNALQRRSNIVVQKSLAEGFGLTVAEAMWKARPVVASRIGGIQDQIVDGKTGVLVDDARDLEAYGAAVVGLLEDVERAETIGLEAQSRVRDEFLGPRHLLQYFTLLSKLMLE
jgi:trehalose synthase